MQMAERLADNTELICAKMDENNKRLQDDIHELKVNQSANAERTTGESIAIRDMLIDHIGKTTGHE